MRPRRRRPRGPRPDFAGGTQGTPATPGMSGNPAPEAGQYLAPTGGQQQQRRRRRRPRGMNRPLNNSAPQPYATNNHQAGPMAGPRMQNQGQRRRRGRGPGRGGPQGHEKRKGLEVLRDLQQVGVALDPTERLILELPPGKGAPPYGDRITGRAIDLVAPIGRGQRCLIVSPPKAGKTRILQIIAAAVAFNHPEVGIYALLVDERPEEVTDFRRNTPANVIAASSDMSVDEHIETAEHAMEVVASQVIEG